MPTLPSLKFLAKGTAMVPDYSAQVGGVRRFHGYAFDRALGPQREVRNPLTGAPSGEGARPGGGFVKQLGLVVEIKATDPYLAEYIRHLRAGDLWPADEYTASFARQPFDASFGGEHSDEAKAAAQRELDEARSLAAESAPKTPTLMQPSTPAKKG